MPKKPALEVSVAQLALVVQRLSPDTSEAQAIERVRGWVRQDLLQPLKGHEGGGPGLHKKFSADTLYAVGVLNTLIRWGALMLPVPLLTMMNDIMWRELKRYRRGVATSVWLELAYYPRSEGSAQPTGPTVCIREQKPEVDPQCSLQIIINVSRVFGVCAAVEREQTVAD